MKRLHRSILHIARFVLEAKTALSIGSGGADGVYDHPIVRDANGLPTLPGTSLAGILRHLWVQDHGYDQAAANALFGYQYGNQGEASRLEVAAGALHDSHNQPVEGLLLGPAQQRLRRDPLLFAAVQTREDPRFRDRVKLNHRGVAANTGKFDRGLLATGYRFSSELRLWSEAREDQDWAMLLNLLNDPRLRLGGATRAGLGALRLVALHTGCFDLRNEQDIAAFQTLKPGLSEYTGLMAVPLDRLAAAKEEPLTLSIELTPRDFWRIGQGDAALGRGDKTPDLLPKLEPIVVWSQNHAEIRTQYALAPSSSIKGALAHRTAFHWNALSGRFVDSLTPEEIAQWDKSEHCRGVQQIFGSVKHNQGNTGNTNTARGQAGHLLIDDVHIEITEQDKRQHVQAMIHNSIDRFTGGVRDRMLFTEELIYQRPIPLRMVLLPGIDQADATARRALARAIRDLCEGRLALGAGVTKGHGSFTGTPDAHTRDWLRTQGEDWT